MITILILSLNDAYKKKTIMMNVNDNYVDVIMMFKYSTMMMFNE